MILVNNEEMEWHEGLTVQDILDKKNFTFRMLSVWVNDQSVERGRFAKTFIPDNATVQILHMISGG